MTKRRSVRPIFFAPWWYFVWTGGKRYSLRRSILLAAAVVTLAEIVVCAARFAFGGARPSIPVALATAQVSALAVACFALLEAPFAVAVDSVRAGTWSPGRLRSVSYGMQVAYAAGFAGCAFVLAPRIGPLAEILHRVRVQNGHAGGDARFIIGATLIFVPLVLGARLLALRAPAPRRADASFFPRPNARHAFGERTYRKIDGPGEPPIAPLSPRPARIVKVDVGPAEPLDP